MTTLALGTLGYGAAALGNLYSRIDDDEAVSTLDAAWDGGIRYFDTAPHYGLGLSEKRLGAFLRTKLRSDFVLSTKVGRLLVDNPQFQPGNRDTEGFDVEARTLRRWDYSEAGIRRSLEESLTRLGVDSVDVLYLHDPEAHGLAAALSTALPALQKLKAEGLVQAVGVGSNSAEAVAALLAESELDVVMLAGRYTLLEQHALGTVLHLCEERGTRVVAAGVFNSGILARSAVPETAHYNYQRAPADLLHRARLLAGICRRYSVELPAAALQYPLRHPAVCSVVIGAHGADQMSSNIANMAAAIPEALWADLAAQGLVPPESSTA
ncbi:aldo/keto reductase [Arthrobacter sp. Hz1]